ncbi:MAG TPA: head GIN domain-containing protein [Allosphingosinicella sp.]
MRAAIIAMSVLALAACSRGADAHEGDREGAAPSSGTATARNYQVEDFQKIALRGPHDVIVTVGGAASVRAEGSAEAMEKLEIRVENGRLIVGGKRKRKDGGWFNHSTGKDKVVVTVTVPSLAAASVEGSGDIRIDKVQGDEFEGEIAGSGDLEIGDVRVKRTEFSIAGSGGIRAKGATDSAEVSIAGSGDVDVSALQAKTAEISIAGSGGVRANASETADVSIMGSGDVTMTGSAKCSISKMGSGNVTCGG